MHVSTRLPAVAALIEIRPFAGETMSRCIIDGETTGTRAKEVDEQRPQENRWG